MEFIVLETSYINGGLREPGYKFDYDEKKWRDGVDTNIAPVKGKGAKAPAKENPDPLMPYKVGKQDGSVVETDNPSGLQPDDTLG